MRKSLEEFRVPRPGKLRKMDFISDFLSTFLCDFFRFCFLSWATSSAGAQETTTELAEEVTAENYQYLSRSRKLDFFGVGSYRGDVQLFPQETSSAPSCVQTPTLDDAVVTDLRVNFWPLTSRFVQKRKHDACQESYHFRRVVQ